MRPQFTILEWRDNVSRLIIDMKKYLKLPAVSRSIILQTGKQLRELPSSRGFKEVAKAMLDIQYGWLETPKQKFKEGADQKKVIAQRTIIKYSKFQETLNKLSI